MARMRKLFFSNCSMMSPMALRRMASGLMMVKVRSRVFISSPQRQLSSCSQPQGCRHRLSDFGWRAAHPDSRSLHGLDFFPGGALSPGNNCPGVAHAPSRRSRLPGYKPDHGLFHTLFHELRSRLFGIAANLPNQDHGFGLGVAIEQVEGVGEVGSNDWITTDSDGCRLS